MITVGVMQELCRLSELYKLRWGKEVDYIGMPATISQERLLFALRYAVKTGDSILVSLQKVKDLICEYHNYLEQQRTLHSGQLQDGHTYDRCCPLCGNKVKHAVVDNSYVDKCETEFCLYFSVRGL